MQRLTFILLLIISCYSIRMLGQEKLTPATIEALTKDYLSDSNSNGLSIAILQNDDITYYNLGRQSAKVKAPPTNQHLYEIASMTKTMTAAILSQMVYEDKLNFNDPISKFLPDSVVTWTEDHRITLMELVTHQSGLPRLPANIFMTVKDPDNPYANYYQKDLYDFLKYYKPQSVSNRKIEYSNLGFGLLGHILSIADSLTFGELMASRVLNRQREGMACVELESLALELIMQGHKMDGTPTSLWDSPILGGAGAVKANSEFMIHYLKEQIDDPKYNSLHRPVKKNQGQAWITSKLKSGDTFVWHNGGTYGFASFGAFSKEHKVAVIVLSNTGNSVDKLGVSILEKLMYK